MNKKVIVTCLIMVVCSFAACGAEDSKEENPSATYETVSEKTKENGNSKLTAETLMEYAASEDSDFFFDPDDEGGCSAETYYGKDKIIVVPEEHNSLPVKRLGKYVFSNMEELEGLLIPNSVIEIEEGICGLDTALKIVVLGTDVKSIGEDAFLGCSSLETVVLNEGLEKIDSMAFSMCSSLMEVDIPESVLEIHKAAFYGHPEEFKIIGKSGSYAEQFATENNIEFVAK